MEEEKKIIRECPYCHSPMEIKSPWKSLFRKPTVSEWITLGILAMLAVAAYAYNHDIGICREYIKNFDYYCLQKGNNQSGYYNYTNFTLGTFLLNKTDNNQST
jgi:hypothetical protein